MPYTIHEAKELCAYLMRKDIPTFVSGPPGVGKSELWKQLADEASMGFIDLRLSQMDPTDVLGLPRYDAKSDRTRWARPEFWPDEERDGKHGIMLFDELSDAGRAMQSVAYQIILNRRAGPHFLPKGWYPCAAGNRRMDRAAAQVLSTALANRFAHLDVDADIEAFKLWANQNNVSEMVVAFLTWRPNLLHSMEGADLRAFPTPRSWFQASKVCDAPASHRMRLVASLVGEGAAGEFEGFMRVYNDLPSIKEILSDPAKARMPKADQPAAKYALTTGLSRAATRQNLDRVWTYIKRPEFGREFSIVTMLDATKRDTDLTETKAYVEFANANQDLQL